MEKPISRRRFLGTASKAIATASAGGAVAGVVSACGGSGKAAKPKTSGKPKGSITVFADANPQGQGLQSLIPEFQSQTGIKVNYQVLSELDITQKATVALAAGNGTVDVTWGGLSEKPAWVKAGWVEPIDDYLTARNLVGPDLNTSDFIPACWKATEDGGQHYGMPTLLDTNLLMYRKDILSKHSLSSPPATIDDLMSACEKVNKSPLPAIALRGARGVHSNIWIFNIFYYGLGGTYYTGQRPGGAVPSGRLSADMKTAAGLKGLQTYTDFFKNGYTPSGSASWDYPETSGAFKSGKVAMLVDDVAFGLEMSDALGSKVGFALAPKGPSGLFPGFDTQMWFLAKGSSNKEAAIKFMAWSTSPAVQARAGRQGKYLGVTRQSTLKAHSFHKLFAPDLVSAYTRSLPHLDINHFVQTPSFNVIGDYMSVAVNQSISGGNPTSALAQAQQQAVSYLASHQA